MYEVMKRHRMHVPMGMVGHIVHAPEQRITPADIVELDKRDKATARPNNDGVVAPGPV